jgi:competence ComEA-like helix-hairpin-helix protein
MLCVAASVGMMLAAAHGQQPAADKGQEVFAKVCSKCHSTQLVTSSRQTRPEWEQTVNQMKARGAVASDAELLAVVDYLSAHYGRVDVNTATADEITSETGLLPEQADLIVEYRRDHGPIDSFDELEKIPGLDSTKLEISRAALTFGVLVPGLGRVPVSALTQANNWPTIAGSPQRDGWAKTEQLLSKNTIKALKLLYIHKFDNQSEGLRSLTYPVVIGALYGYQGIKQMLIVGGSSDSVYSIDADLDRVIWSIHLERQGEKPRVTPGLPCPVALTAVVVPGTTMFGGSSYGNFLRTGPVFAVSSDGYLHTMYQSDGTEENAPIRIVPANSVVSSLNMSKATIYATTIGSCGAPNGIYTLDSSTVDRKVVSFVTNGSGPSGAAGTAIGSDGTLYAQIAEGEGNVAGKYHDTVLALTPDDLRVRDYFTPLEIQRTSTKDTELDGVTPAVFQWKDREIILAGGRDGRIYLLDATSLGGPDHHTPLYRSEPIAATSAGSGIRGAFSTWEDPETKIRWVYVSLWGRPDQHTSFPATNGPVANGGIAAFKVEDRNGKPALVPAWISQDMTTPAAPAIANGLVFALSTGQPARLFRDNGVPYGTQELNRAAKTAILHAFDSATGRELFSSGNDATSFSYGSGLAVANGKIYFTTHDNTAYVFGFPTLGH